MKNVCVGMGVLLMMSMNSSADPLNEILKITPVDLDSGDRFGTSVDASENMVLIGSRSDDDSGLNDGAAYLFDITNGAQIFKLVPNDNAQGNNFGSAVAIEMESTPSIAVIGKYTDRDEGVNAGAIYLYNADTGSQITKLYDPKSTGGEQFGFSVEIENGMVVVGSPLNSVSGASAGRAFVINAMTGSFVHTLESDTAIVNARFGSAVAISEEYVVVGAGRESTELNEAGAAYIFDLTTGNQLARFVPDDVGFGDRFGSSISISGDFVAIGTPFDGDDGPGSGSVYVYNISDPSNPLMIEKILAPDAAPGDQFGHDVHLREIDNGFKLAIGSWRDDVVEAEAGSVYIIELDSAGNSLSNQLVIASDTSEDAFLGTSVAVNNDGRVVGGAPDDNTLFSNAGAVYVFESGSDNTCPADLSGDGVLNFFDVSAFLSAFNSMDPIADFTNDGVFNFFDISAFLSAFNEGCP